MDAGKVRPGRAVRYPAGIRPSPGRCVQDHRGRRSAIAVGGGLPQHPPVSSQIPVLHPVPFGGARQVRGAATPSYSRCRSVPSPSGTAPPPAAPPGGAIAAAVAFSPLPPYARFRPSRIPFAGLRSHVSSAAWRRFATRIQVPSAGRPRRRWWWAAFYSASSTCPRRLPVPGRLIRSRHLPPAACRTVCGRCTSNTCSGTVPSGRGSSRRGLPVRPDRPPCTAPHPCVIRPMYESAIAGMHGPASRLGI